MRLDRYVSQATGLSRADVRRRIRKGQVCVDGVAARDPARHVPEGLLVTLRGDVLALPGERYLMLHKPAGLVCATQDKRQATVMALLPGELAEGLHIVGRLDRDTTGLLLLTTDGAWTHRITSPRTHCLKTYVATLAEPLSGEALARLRGGVELRGEGRPTRPAQVEQLDDLQIRIGISEGRYHQVRRMLAAVGNHVTALHREAIGGLRLAPGLAAGAWRNLEFAEREAVFSDARGGG